MVNRICTVLAIVALFFGLTQQQELWGAMPRKLRLPLPLLASEQHDSIWEKMQATFNLHTVLDNSALSKINKYIKHYQYHHNSLYKLTHDASPYLYFVMQEVEKRNLPLELALLPFIESSYKPHAVSSHGARGIWQMIPATAKRFGVRHSHNFDGQKDFAHQTQAALNYLEHLNNEFNGDWLLTLAAYNAGEGTVIKALKRNKNAKSFFDLKLPKETEEFVPKFLAMAEVIRHYNPESFALPLIKNSPYFKEVNLPRPIDLKMVANLAEVNYKEVQRLNPGLLTKLPNSNATIRLPIESVVTFHTNLKKLKH